MRILKVKPGKKPVVIDIEDKLEVLQKEVGGYIQVLYPFEDEVAIVCDDDGKMKSKELNRALETEEGHVYDVLVGDFLIVGVSSDEFCSLSDELIEKYTKKYAEPDEFMHTAFGLILFRGNKTIPIS